MQRIEKIITRERTHGGVTRKVVHRFNTWDVVLQPTEGLPENLGKCFEYLKKVFEEDFVERESSPSQMPLLDVKFKKVFEIGKCDAKEYESSVCRFAEEANYKGMKNYQHWTVQDYTMQNHPDCLAVEVPVDNGELSGLMDFLFYIPADDSFFVWDFKPKAARDRTAPTQVHYYRKLFSFASGIPVEKIQAGWFDEKHAFQLFPLIFSKA